MRIINADALKDKIMFRYAAPEMVWDRGDIEHKIDEMPTVDAIPMWWITEKFLDVLNKDSELSKAVWLVRKAWQKEQEAQDG